MLQSHDEQNIILVTYKDLKKALNKCFSDLYLQQTKDQQHRLQLWLFIVQEFWIIIDDFSKWWLTYKSMSHHLESSREENLWKSGFSSFLVVFKIAFAFGPIIHFVELVWIIIMSHRRQDPPSHHLRWPIIASQSPLANQPTHHAYHPIIISQSLFYSLLTPTRWRQRAANDDS